jgi:hypothetical protein
METSVGPRLMVCHRYNSEEVRQADPDRIKALVQMLSFLMTPSSQKRGAFHSLELALLDEQNGKGDVTKLRENLYALLKKDIPLMMYPKSFECYYDILRSVMMKICTDPIPFSTIIRNFIINEIGICQKRCAACRARCENYAMHSTHQCFNKRAVCITAPRDAEISNTLNFHKGCKHVSPLMNDPSYVDMDIKSIIAQENSLFGFGFPYWECKNCDFTESETVWNGGVFSPFATYPNAKVDQNRDAFYFHCFPCNREIWDKKRQSPKCMHADINGVCQAQKKDMTIRGNLCFRSNL